ncbi:BnaC03g30110D [Brassica napus]|uniref:BnaC03g30110D protein n=1 Tax=Brassica napus TaxID=3708 RepID=A0A078G8I1_BRANA|nr:BnaC03g30110D [Brassica napus]
MTRLQQIPMVSFLLSSSAPTTQITQLNHGVHLSLKNPSVAHGIALGLMSPDPPEPPDPPDLGSVMVTMGMDLRVVPAEECDSDSEFPDPSYLSDKIRRIAMEMVEWIIFCSAWTYGLV